MHDKSLSRFNEDVSIVLCGAAGQGIQTVEHILTQTLKLSGYHVFSSEEYMSRIRGGSNSTLIRVSSNRVSAPVDRIDLLIPFSPGAISHVQKGISPETVLLGEKKIVENEYLGNRVFNVPFSEIASEVGGPIYTNTVAVALLAGLLGVEREVLNQYLRHHFAGKDETIVHKNIEAVRRGYGVSDDLLRNGKLHIDLEKHNGIQEELLIDGVEALAMGADSLLADTYLTLRDIATKYGHPRLDYAERYWFWNLTATRCLQGLVERGVVTRRGIGQYRFSGIE